MRLFIAIYPSKEVLDYLRDVKRHLDKQKRNLRFVDPEKLQITLRYVGSNVSPATKNVLAAELQRRAGSYIKPEIKVSGMALGFPRQRDPRVVMANIEPNYDLDELIDGLHRYVRGIKRRDTIKWKTENDDGYHISLARLKPAATKRIGYQVDDMLKNMNIPLPEPFVPEHMYLVSSEPTNKAPVYKKLEMIKL